MRGRLSLVVAALSGIACTSAPPPYGEAIVIVDTDLQVPRMASRLRVDIFDAQGNWKETRDFPRLSAADWPASFSLYAGPTTDEQRFYVRLRAYPDGYTRQFGGEHYQPKFPYQEPKVATSVAELCAAPAVLKPDQTVTLRRGREPFLGPLKGSTDCASGATQVGSVAVELDIPTNGVWNIGVLSTSPTNADLFYGTVYLQTTIEL